MSGTTGEDIESTVRTDSASTALHVGHRCNWENGTKGRFCLSTYIEHSVGRRLLKEKGWVFSAAGGVVDPTVVIRGQSPLSTSSRKLLRLELSVYVSVANVLVGDVYPVVQVPDETARLVFHVASAVTSLEDLDFLVSDTVPIGVAVIP